MSVFHEVLYALHSFPVSCRGCDAEFFLKKCRRKFCHTISVGAIEVYSFSCDGEFVTLVFLISCAREEFLVGEIVEECHVEFCDVFFVVIVRIILEDIGDIFFSEYHNRNLETVVIVDNVSYFFCEFFGTCFTTPEDDIPALDIDEDVLIPSLLKKGFEVFHIYHPLSTDIDATKHRYIGIHTWSILRNDIFMHSLFIEPD